MESVNKLQNTSESGSILIPKLGGTDNNKKKPHRRKLNKKLTFFLGSILFVLTLFGSYIGLTSYKLYKNSFKLYKSALSLKDAVKSQDLGKIKPELEIVKANAHTLLPSIKSIQWLKGTPYVGKYIEDSYHGLNTLLYGIDALEVGLDIVTPYSDILGLGGTNPGHDISAQERIDFVIKTIPDVIPKSDTLSSLASKINDELEFINPDDYPKEFKGFIVRDNLKKAKEYVQIGSEFVINGKPLLLKAQYLLGVDSERTYLVLFQNDKELRPTGGFLTAYSIAKVKSGKFEPVLSDDIYNLDINYKPSIAAPKPIIDHIKGPYVLLPKLRLRDMNWDVSFPDAMKLFSQEAKKAKLQNYDGIIAVDTQVLVNLLNVIGSVDVPGYGKFSNEITPKCDCPQVIYELESIADNEGAVVWSENEPGKIVFAPRDYDNRKKIIGPLMNSILSSTLGQPKEKIPLLFEAMMKSLLEKHVLFYVDDVETQNALSDFGIAGSVKDYDGDYLFINDANLGGRKSNLYVTQEIHDEVSISKGKAVHTLTITYKNPASHDGWLNSVLPNYTRIYVPESANIVDITGFTQKEDSYIEHGKKVIPGFFELRPQGVSKVSITYETSVNSNSEYKLYIQKQPGKDAPLYSVSVNGKTDEFVLNTDHEIKISL